MMKRRSMRWTPIGLLNARLTDRDAKLLLAAAFDKFHGYRDDVEALTDEERAACRVTPEEGTGTVFIRWQRESNEITAINALQGEIHSSVLDAVGRMLFRIANGYHVEVLS